MAAAMGLLWCRHGPWLHHGGPWRCHGGRHGAAMAPPRAMAVQWQCHYSAMAAAMAPAERMHSSHIRTPTEERLASRGWAPFTLEDALLHTCHTRPEAEEMQDHQQKRGWPREPGSHSRRRPAAFAPYNTTRRRNAQDSRQQFGNAFSLALVLSICLIYFYINDPLCKSTTMFAFSCSVCPGLARRPGWPSWACLPEGQIFKDCGASWLELNNCEHTNQTT